MEQLWLAEPNFLIQYLGKLENASAKEIQAATDLFGETEPPSILTIEGEEAIISITGPMSRTGPGFLARLFGFGGTAYNDIIESLKLAQENPVVKKIRLKMDTPGGEVKGTDDVFQAVQAAKKEKPVIAENYGMIASGGYWIASAASQIIATSPSAETGSIGIVVVAIDFSKMDEKAGIKVITITSKNAPNKYPDISKKAGRDIIQERLDALERVFISRIAEGRGVTMEHVQQNFGQGALLIAQDPDNNNPDALSVGMIDAVDAKIKVGGSSAGNGPSAIFAGTPPFKDYKIVGRPWDGDAATKRVRTKTGSTEKPSSSYKNAFFWFDSKDADNFGAYKLPFVDVVNGELVAIRKGIFAADAAMGGARTGKPPKIPAKDRPAVQAHIDRYKAKIEKQDKKKKSTNSQEAKMKLQEWMAESHANAFEIEARDKEKFASGEQSATAKIKARIKKAITCLGAESEYPNAIKALALKVLDGDEEPAALSGAMAVHDSNIEAAAAAAAAKETLDQKETPGGQPAGGSDDGVVRSDEELAAAAARIKG